MCQESDKKTHRFTYPPQDNILGVERWSQTGEHNCRWILWHEFLSSVHPSCYTLDITIKGSPPPLDIFRTGKSKAAKINCECKLSSRSGKSFTAYIHRPFNKPSAKLVKICPLASFLLFHVISGSKSGEKGVGGGLKVGVQGWGLKETTRAAHLVMKPWGKRAQENAWVRIFFSARTETSQCL